jgi:hypothetical protein
VAVFWPNFRRLLSKPPKIIKGAEKWLIPVVDFGTSQLPRLQLKEALRYELDQLHVAAMLSTSAQQRAQTTECS